MEQTIFLDFETTGLNTEKDRIVQYYLKNIDTGEVLEGLLNPTIPISPEASAKHGISNEKVSNEPTFKQMATKIFNFIVDRNVGGHNVKVFDIPLLIQELDRCGIKYFPENVKIYDTCEVFRKFEPHTLEKALDFYCHETLENAHQANADVEASIKVYFAEKTKYLLSDQDFETGKYPDLIGRLVLIDGVICYNFGKYQGKAVTTFPDYAAWIINSDFPAITKNALRKALSK